MRALVVTGPGHAEVVDVDPPEAGTGDVVVDMTRVGICGTDLEFFTGGMAYLHTGHASYPMRIGHEWSGTVRSVGPGVPLEWLGTRVTGDTMLGCGRCRRCTSGRQYLCEDRLELGIRGGMAGALAEQMSYPARFLLELPDAVDDVAGALVEPGGNALRAVQAVRPRPGDTVLITGTGTIALLCAMFARMMGADVHLVGRSESSLAFARELGFEHAWDWDTLPQVRWDAVVEASNSPQLPSRAVDLVEPGGIVAFIGVAGSPSLVDTRQLVINNVAAVGILSASPALAETIACYAGGVVDPRPLVAATVRLEDIVGVLGGSRPSGASNGPKIQVSFGPRG